MSNFGFNTFKNFPELNINNHMKLRIISLSVLLWIIVNCLKNNLMKNLKVLVGANLMTHDLITTFLQILLQIGKEMQLFELDYERRQALVEIDVLVAQELGLTLEELKRFIVFNFQCSNKMKMKHL